MGEGFIEKIDHLLENWEPIERFNIEKVTEGNSNYNKHSVQYTPEFKEKLKEVLK
jgi:hypothetical protein